MYRGIIPLYGQTIQLGEWFEHLPRWLHRKMHVTYQTHPHIMHVCSHAHNLKCSHHLNSQGNVNILRSMTFLCQVSVRLSMKLESSPDESCGSLPVISGQWTTTKSDPQSTSGSHDKNVDFLEFSYVYPVILCIFVLFSLGKPWDLTDVLTYQAMRQGWIVPRESRKGGLEETGAHERFVDLMDLHGLCMSIYHDISYVHENHW